MKPSDFKYISFFSGALGLDQGLEKAGLIPLAYNEFDKKICRTIRSNRPKVKLYDFDIRNITPEQLMSDLGIEPNRLFLIAGGPPCQAFSTAGKRLGLNDERGNVFFHYIDIIGKLKPLYVIIENVRGLLSTPLKHRPHSLRVAGNPPLTKDELPKGALRRIISELNSHGYKVSFNLYNTANFGVPQIRERVIMFGTLGEEPVPDLFPTHDEFGRHGLGKWKTFAEAVENIEGSMEWSKFPESRLKYYKLLKSGQNWKNLSEEDQKNALGKSYFSGGGKTGFFRRLSWDRPSPTLVTCPTMPATDLAHPEEDRPLSVQEYKRLQTFPDTWILEGGISDKYRQLGNAVPVDFGYAIGKHLQDNFQGLHKERVLSPIPLSRYLNTDHVSWLGNEEDEPQLLPFQ